MGDTRPRTAVGGAVHRSIQEAPLRTPPASPTPGGEGRAYLQWLLVPDRGDAVALPVARIDWIGAEDNYLRIHAGSSAYLIRETMQRLSALLDPAVFLRVHRSTLVNLYRVKALRRWGPRDYVVVMENGTEHRMGRTYLRALNTTVRDYR